MEEVPKAKEEKGTVLGGTQHCVRNIFFLIRNT